VFTAVRDPAWKIVGDDDFDGDGLADLFWRNTTTGANVIWRGGNAATRLAVARVPDVRFAVVGTGDFDGDGRADILWRHPDRGYFVWPAANASLVFEVGSAPVVAIADIDQDGRDDLVECGVYLPFGVVTCSLLPGADWTRIRQFGSNSQFDLAHSQVQAVGDFDGDGYVDLFWRNTVTGENTLWPVGSPALKRTLVPVPDVAWQVVASGDYDGDGKADLFWRHGTRGYVTLWPAADGRRSRFLAQVPMAWSVVP
jgi:hypothetical protein